MLGIDIGHHSVKIVEIVEGRVLNASKVTYTPGAGGADVSEESVLSALREAVNSINAAGKGAWGSIAGGAVITHLTNYPAMEEPDLGGAVKLEAEQFVSRDWDEMDFDYQILSRAEDGGYRVLFVTAPKGMSDKKMSFLKQTGVYPSGMSVDSLAIATAFSAGGQDASTKDVAEGAVLIHVGARIASIALFDNNQIVVLRDVTFGGDDITKKLMQEFNTDFAGAEAIKEQSEPEVETRVKDGVERALRPLMQQISMTIGYERRKGHLDNGHIYLAGGGVRAPGVTELLGKKFGLDVEFMNPFSGLDIECELPPGNDLKSDFTVAVGCALIGGGGDEKQN